MGLCLSFIYYNKTGIKFSLSSGTHSINDGEAFSDYDLINVVAQETNNNSGGGFSNILVSPSIWGNTNTNALSFIRDLETMQVKKQSDTSFEVSHVSGNIVVYKISGINL